MDPFTQGVRLQNSRSPLLGFESGFFLTTTTPHRFPAAILRVGHGRQLPTTELEGEG